MSSPSRCVSQTHYWFCDGTFDSTPNGHQLYTLHVIADGSRTVPVVYCIARKKDRNTYDRIFQFLKDRRPNLSPLTVMIDFEMAALQSLQHHFPEAEIQGCLFILVSAVWRNVQRLGLQGWYKDDANNALIIKSFQALAFVPPNRVAEAFQELMGSLDDETDELLSDFLSYFEATGICVVQRGRRHRPLFAISLWNVNSRVEQDLPRTNNSIEGWHHSFDLRVAITHPTIRRLSAKLVKEQASNELLLEQVLARIPKNPYQSLKFLYFRQVVVSAKFLFGEKSVRQTVRSTNCSQRDVSLLDTARSTATRDGSGGCECADGSCHSVSNRVCQSIPCVVHISSKMFLLSSYPKHKQNLRKAVCNFPESCECIP